MKRINNIVALMFFLILSCNAMPGYAHSHTLPGTVSSKPLVPASPVSAAARMHAASNIGDKPLFFIENIGQIKDQQQMPRTDIQFKLAARGMNVFIGRGSMHYQWNRYTPAAKQQESNAVEVTSYRMDMTLIGANMEGALVREAVYPYFEKYYAADLGPEGALAAAYTRITYKEVYPDIDWVLYVKDGAVKYDFIVHPGGRTSDIKISYGGATSLKPGKDGGIVATTPFGSVSERAPYSYQEDGRMVASAFVLKDQVLGFETAPHQGRLVIDPELAWATYYGDVDDDFAEGVAYDKVGNNVYLTGHTYSADNIATTDGFLNTYTGFLAAFLVKFDSAGHRKWGTYYGEGGNTWGISVACDEAGNAYMSGYTTSLTEISAGNAHQPNHNGVKIKGVLPTDGFLVKFNSAGDRIWGTYYGGVGEDKIWSISCDGKGSIYAAGFANSDTAIATANGFQKVRGGEADAFLVKFDTAGNRKWGTYYGGSGTDHARSIACDKWGSVILGGFTYSDQNIASNTTVFQPDYMGGMDGFIVRFDGDGNRKWGTYYGGESDDFGQAVAVDDTGNIFFAGETLSENDMTTPGSFRPSRPQMSNTAFLGKLDSLGNRKWGTYYYASDNSIEGAFSLVCDNMGQVYMGGYSFSDTGLATPGGIKNVSDYSGDIFIAKFDGVGHRVWGTYYGGEQSEGGYGMGAPSMNNNTNFFGMAFDGFNNLYIGGTTVSEMDIATTTGFQPVSGGSYDGFLARIYDCPALAQPGAVTGPVSACSGSTEIYSVPAVNGAMSYTWTLPGGWTGTSTTNQITVVAGSAGGNITVVANSMCTSSPVRTLSVAISAAVSPEVTITADPGNDICSGETVVFTATALYGGASPVYIWLKNGATVTAPGNTYTDAALNNNDVITCVLSSSAACASPATDTSNVMTMNVRALVIPDITVTASPGDTACSGDLLTFTAQVLNGGTTPVYTWLKNGSVSGSNAPVYTDMALNDLDVVQCVLTSNERCASPVTDTSNSLLITINMPVVPTVSILASPGTTVPDGTSVTFTASVTHGGANPVYQWRLNEMPVTGVLVNTYTTDSLRDGDVVACVMHSDAACAVPDSAVSNAIEMYMTLHVGMVRNGSPMLIFPNPAKDMMHIQTSEPVNITITGMDGKLMLQLENTRQADIRNLAAGCYQVRLSSTEGTLIGVEKLVKMNE